MIALPIYIDPMLWAAFVEQRKAMKVPFTQQAQKLVVMKLMKMHAEGWDCNASLERARSMGIEVCLKWQSARRPMETKTRPWQSLRETRRYPKAFPQS